MDNAFTRLLNHEDHDLSLGELTIRVRDGVFSPDPLLTNSSSLLLKHIPDVTGKIVLDIGSGTGIISLYAALHGAKHVTATDVSDASLKNIRENVERFHLEEKIDIRQSDLFSHVPESFDYIFANLPIIDEAWSQEEGSTQHLVQSFLDQLPRHLNEGGSGYLTWGSFSDVTPLKNYLSTSSFNVEEVREDALGYTWYLFILSKR